MGLGCPFQNRSAKVKVVLLLLAQTAQLASDWATPVTGAVGLGGLFTLIKILLGHLHEMRREMNENSRSLEKSLFYNTEATLMMVFLHEAASDLLKAKVKEAQEQNRRHEAEREAQSKSRSGSKS